MARIEESIEVNVPVSTAYNQWTQFEEYPNFMENVEQVQQLDDSRLFWAADVGGQRKEWYARIKRQVPDEVIAWESEDGARNDGTVSFTPIDAGRTRVDLQIELEPAGLTEQVGAAIGIPGSAVRGDLERFKEFIEQRGVETGAWRGQIPPSGSV